jgi:acyl-CoA reductase-like NAD-dependent aldehyde dehydrogenase
MSTVPWPGRKKAQLAWAKLSFTERKAILQEAQVIKNVTLELGGNDPAIVLRSAFFRKLRTLAQHELQCSFAGAVGFRH